MIMVSVVLLKRNLKVIWYICVGLFVSLWDIFCFRVKYVRNDFKNNLFVLKIIYFGLVIIMVIYYFKGFDVVGLGGRNFRKLICLLICVIKESKIVDVELNKSMLKLLFILLVLLVNFVYFFKFELGWLNMYNRGISCNII